MTAKPEGVMAVDEHETANRARRGERAAFDSLFQEHASAAWRLALAVGREPAEAADAVAEAFGKVLGHGEREAATRRVPVRMQLLAATREAAIDGPAHLRRPATEPAWTPPGTRTLADPDSVLDAFDRLPERWRSVLWLTQVEGLDAADAGTVLDLTPQSTDGLCERALTGFREQLAQAQVRSAVRPDCQRTAVRLGGYVTDALPARDAARVRSHLDRCAACRSRLDAIDDLAPRLRRGVPPLPLLVFGLAELVWMERTASATGPLRLALPGGRPLPPWAERVLAGATAAVVTLGITSAILAGGRGTKSTRDQMATTDQPVSLADGESALGDEYPPVVDGPFDEPATDPGPDTPRHVSPSPTTSAVPPGTGAPDVPRGSSSPTPTGPATPNPPTTPTEPVDPTEPPITPSGTAPLVSVQVDDTTGISVGGDCTGVEIVSIVVGCEPTEGSGSLPVVGPLLGL